MKTKAILKRCGMILLCLWFGTSWMTGTAFARGVIDTGQEGSLNFYFSENGTGFLDVSFSVYRVAGISDDGTYTLEGDFAQYPVRLEDLDSSGWRALAQTLDAYVARDKITPLLTRQTGQNGSFRITGLSTGLYLVSGGQYVDGTVVYMPQPVLVSIPGPAAGGEWNYDVEVSCKFDREETEDLPTSRKVQKVWEDDGNEEKRPREITVQLLENGNVVDTAILNRENNWEYTWEELDGSSKWQIVETVVPDGYTVTMTQEGNVFVLTNTCPPGQPSKLPQTGMLWWPVPLLACSGLLLLAVGLAMRRKQGDVHER